MNKVLEKPNKRVGATMANMVTAKEWSQYLKLSDYSLASSGMLQGFKIGYSWRFDLDEIMLSKKKIKKKNGGKERDINGKDRKRKWDI